MGLPLQVVRGKGRQSYDLVMNVNLRDRILLKVSGASQAVQGHRGHKESWIRGRWPVVSCHVTGGGHLETSKQT